MFAGSRRNSDKCLHISVPGSSNLYGLLGLAFVPQRFAISVSMMQCSMYADDAMVLVARVSDLRAMGQEIASRTFGKYPTIQVDLRGHDEEIVLRLIPRSVEVTQVTPSVNQVTSPEGQPCLEALRDETSAPATVWPNVKRLKMPWKIQHGFSVTENGETPQGEPLASRAPLGVKGLYNPNPGFGAGGSLLQNAEFFEIGRLQGGHNLSRPVPYECRSGINPPDFEVSTRHTGLHERDRAIFRRDETVVLLL